MTPSPITPTSAAAITSIMRRPLIPNSHRQIATVTAIASRPLRE